MYYSEVEFCSEIIWPLDNAVPIGRSGGGRYVAGGGGGGAGDQRP